MRHPTERHKYESSSGDKASIILYTAKRWKKVVSFALSSL